MKKCSDCKKKFELHCLSEDGLCPECLYDANARILGYQPLTVAALLASQASEVPEVSEYCDIEMLLPPQIRIPIDKLIRHLQSMKSMGAKEVWLDGTGPDQTRFREFGVDSDENNRAIGVIEIDLAPNAVGHPPRLHPPSRKGT